VVMQGSVKNVPLIAAAFEFGFLGGSMGSVVGERFVRGVQACCDEGLPFVCFTATGGARMQEGLLSLMQMAKTTAALHQLSAARETGLVTTGAAARQWPGAQLATITVGGTNGKGSTCAYLERILVEAGYRTGLYTSPHLARYNERVRIDGAEAGDGELVDAFE